MTLVVRQDRPESQSDKTKVSHGGNSRLGLSVSRKVGNAVHRNRIKRRLREVFRLNQSSLKTGCDLVIVPKAAAASSDYGSLEKAVLQLCRKAGLVRSAP